MMEGGVVERDASLATAGGSLLEDIFRHHHLSLVRSAYLLLGDRNEAEEAVQEAYFRVERAAQRSGSVGIALPYVRAAMVNVCRSGLRRRVVAFRRPPRPSPDATSAEEAAVARSGSVAVVAALRLLPARQRECLVLRYYDDLSETEIASTLGISNGSVKTHVHRGLAALSHVLGEER
jgi:RNA polymerase sigma-70 factor (sigma-E family)